MSHEFDIQMWRQNISGALIRCYTQMCSPQLKTNKQPTSDHIIPYHQPLGVLCPEWCPKSELARGATPRDIIPLKRIFHEIKHPAIGIASMTMIIHGNPHIDDHDVYINMYTVRPPGGCTPMG